jgi:hypothetical protein
MEATMLRRLTRSSGNLLGYEVIGKLTQDDYATVTAQVAALLQQESNIRLLLDLTAFEGEEKEALGPHRRFRYTHRRTIAKMAVVADKKWHEWVMATVDLFYYAREHRLYPPPQREAAWQWLRE